MSFTEKEIKSKFKALMSIFPAEGIKAEDLLIFFRSSPGLAKICDPETGNAAMANAFADLTESYTSKKNVVTFLTVLVRCYPGTRSSMVMFWLTTRMTSSTSPRRTRQRTLPSIWRP
jgi:hypothetical protein